MTCKSKLLFVVGILIIITEIWSLSVLRIASKPPFELSIWKVHWYDYGYTFVWILIGVGICHYALTGNETIYKMLIGLFIVALMYILLAIISDPSKETLLTEVDIISQKLEGMMPDYQWERYDGGNSTKKKATDSWNYLQSLLKCCGLKDGDDWSKFRPTSLAQNVYPNSCCLIESDNYCTKDGFILMDGCISRLKNISSSYTRLWHIGLIGIVIGYMSYSLHKKTNKSLPQ